MASLTKRGRKRITVYTAERGEEDFWETAKLMLYLKEDPQGSGVRETPEKIQREQRGCLVEEECEPHVDAGDWTCPRGHLLSCLHNAKKQMKDCGPPLCEDGLPSMSYALTKVIHGTCVSQGLKRIFLSRQSIF